MIDTSPEEVLTWDMEKLWNALKQLTEKEEYKKDKELIKNGIKVKFPIQYIIQEWYKMNPENKRVTVRGYGKWKIDDFMEEIEEREDLMRQIIIEKMEKPEIAKPRT